MNNDQPAYFAVLPAEVRYDAGLSAFEKILFAEITALTSSEGRCFASNEYFAGLYQKHEKYISTVIKRLGKKGYLRIENRSLGRYGRERDIYLVRKFLDFMPLKKCTSRSEKANLEGRNAPSRLEKANLPYTLSTNFNNTYIGHFEEIWKKHPLKIGKKEAIKTYTATVKTEADRAAITEAQRRYLLHLKENTWKAPQQGKTWLHNWREWTEFVEPPKKQAEKQASTDERREALKVRLKDLYKQLRRKQGYRDGCEADDPRVKVLTEDIEGIQAKIDVLEAKL